MFEFIVGFLVGKLIMPRGHSDKDIEEKLAKLTPEQKEKLRFELASVSPTGSASPTREL